MYPTAARVVGFFNTGGGNNETIINIGINFIYGK